MNTELSRQALTIALTIAERARPIVLNRWRRAYKIEQKADGSLVSEVDQAVETLVREIVADSMPSAGVLGEEFGHTNPDAEIQWVVDPIDGTADFVHGLSTFGLVLGCFINHVSIAGMFDFPALNDRCFAAKGLGAFWNEEKIAPPGAAAPKSPLIALPPAKSLTRSDIPTTALEKLSGAFPDYRTFWTCYSQALAASGKLDASVELNLKLWDIAAAPIIAEESGRLFRWLREPTPWASGRCSAAIGRPELVDSITSILRDVEV
ncbi:MAG: inositol monophosphatase [Bdellovibrionota bacterium]|nr:MAG: inositol monophosphatase [Bdellovibrionota bacterium]